MGGSGLMDWRRGAWRSWGCCSGCSRSRRRSWLELQLTHKYLYGSGSFTRLAPDRVLDLLQAYAVVLCEHEDRLPGAVASGHDPGLDPGARDDRLAEAAARIDDDRPGLVRRLPAADPGIETRREPSLPVDALEARFEDLAQDGLPVRGHIEEAVGLLHEEAHSVRPEAGVDQRPGVPELAPDVAQSLANALHRDAMDLAHRRED